MKRTHVLRTALTAPDCRSLFEEAAALGLRVGWLDLSSAAAVPVELESAAGLGAFRAVGLTAGRVLAVKPVRGAAVLGDLLREHFSGCALVLVRGDVEAPELGAAPEGFRVSFEDGAAKLFSAEGLARALRRPRLQATKPAAGGPPTGR